jgi:hypothetical protein
LQLSLVESVVSQRYRPSMRGGIWLDGIHVTRHQIFDCIKWKDYLGGGAGVFKDYKDLT